MDGKGTETCKVITVPEINFEPMIKLYSQMRDQVRSFTQLVIGLLSKKD